MPLAYTTGKPYSSSATYAGAASAWLGVPIGMAAGPILPSEVSFFRSRRFYYRGDAFFPLQAPMCRKLAYLAFRVNQLERFLSLPVTVFHLRDRLTHARYDLDTAPSSWSPTASPWYSAANLESLLALITTQIRSGGPSGKGANRFYVHEFLVQAQAGLAAAGAAMWADPPTGPGFAGWVFGAAQPLLNQAGARTLATRICAGGGYFPATPATQTLSDGTGWDYAGGAATPKQAFYLPIERLLPDPLENPEAYRGWNTGYFEALQFREGVTRNANTCPPDSQILSEFVTGLVAIPTQTIELRGVGSASTYAQTQNRLQPDSGSLSGGPDYRLWPEGARPFTGDVPGNATLWSVANSGGIVLQKLLSGFYEHRNQAWRIGWETDVAGSPFKLSWWELLSMLVTAEPQAIYLRGTITASNGAGPPLHQPPVALTAKLYLATAPSDEKMARIMLSGAATFTDSLLIASVTAPAGSSPPVTSSFDVDVSSFLTDLAASKALYAVVLLDPTYAQIVSAAVAVEYSSSITLSGLVLEADFGDGRRTLWSVTG
jgi:hypothetical protein